MFFSELLSVELLELSSRLSTCLLGKEAIKEENNLIPISKKRKTKPPNAFLNLHHQILGQLTNIVPL
jgi:hypothetical protein